MYILTISVPVSFFTASNVDLGGGCLISFFAFFRNFLFIVNLLFFLLFANVHLLRFLLFFPTTFLLFFTFSFVFLSLFLFFSSYFLLICFHPRFNLPVRELPYSFFFHRFFSAFFSQFFRYSFIQFHITPFYKFCLICPFFLFHIISFLFHLPSQIFSIFPFVSLFISSFLLFSHSLSPHCLNFTLLSFFPLSFYLFFFIYLPRFYQF